MYIAAATPQGWSSLCLYMPYVTNILRMRGGGGADILCSKNIREGGSGTLHNTITWLLYL